jgi:ubiquinone/menaquinone biosynthesis C-methylase UbiE
VTTREDGEKPTPEVGYWEARAATYDSSQSLLLAEETEAEVCDWLQSQLADSTRLLELGCGTGKYTTIAAGLATEVVATDPSPGMLDCARRSAASLRNVTFRRENARRTTFASGSFDAVLACNLLHVVAAPEAVLAEMLRVLHPGGLALVVDFTFKGLSLADRILAAIRYVRAFGAPSWSQRSYSPSKLASQMSAAGFTGVGAQLLGAGSRLACVVAKGRAPHGSQARL